jgi:hypothetical protein
LVGTAVKVIGVPEQIVVEVAEIITEGERELTVMFTTLLVAVGVEVQPALEVMITLTWSALARVLEVKVGELVPTFTPFICHW